MAVEKGSAFLLKIGNGQAPVVYATIAGIRIDGVDRVVRPSFAALVAVEEETGSLLALAERAALGTICVAEIEALIWHCLDGADVERARLGAALAEMGLTAAMPAVRAILRQLLTGAS